MPSDESRATASGVAVGSGAFDPDRGPVGRPQRVRRLPSWRSLTAACTALALVLPTFASGGVAGAAKVPADRPCPSATRLPDIAAASHEGWVTVPFGYGWYLHEPGSWLNRGPFVSAVQLPHRLLWLSPPLPLGRGTGPWVLYETLGAGMRSGRNAAAGATRLITLPADATRASLADGGDGVAVVDATLKDGASAVLVTSYLHPGTFRTMIEVPATVATSLGIPVVRRGFVAVFRSAGNPAVDAAGVETVARVRNGRLGAMRRYRVGRQGIHWSDEGLIVNGRAVPGISPWPVPHLDGFTAVAFGPNFPPVIDVPTAWSVHHLPCASCYGYTATVPGDRRERLTVWLSPAFTPASMNVLGFVQGPDTPVDVVPQAGRLRWLDDHTVAWSQTIREGGRRYLRVELACVPPEQGSFTATITVPERDAALAWRILSTFRWS